MAFIIKFAKGVRNHWKKSLFATGALAYGATYANDKYQIKQLMRIYCEEAAKYGDVTQNVMIPPKRIVVILNPAAKKRTAEKTFEKYCGPILNLSGCLVDIIKTDSEGHACRYIEELERLPDAILVAGGDGTVSETITGLMRRPQHEQCPIGIMPLGRTNSIAQKIYKFQPNPNSVDEVRELADSTISIVRGKTEKQNIIKIEVLSADDDEQNKQKPIFAAGSIQWGAFRDAVSLRDKYWYFGPFREYASAFFNAFSGKLTWNCNAQVIYTRPCSGCSNCFIKKVQPKELSSGRWWSRFIPKFKLGQFTAQNLEPDYSKITNEDCIKQLVTNINPVEFILTADQDSDIPKLKIKFGDIDLTSIDFILQSWERFRTNKITGKDEISARTLELIPEIVSSENNEHYYSIDNEEFEVRPIKISIIPNAIDVFTL